MARNIIGLIVGLVVGFVLVALFEAGGHWLIPPPADLDMNDYAAVKEYIKTAPEGVMLLLLAAWFIGAFGAVASTALIAKAKVLCGLAIAALFLAFAGFNLVMVPHPTWVMVATPFVYATAASLGISAALAITSSRSSDQVAQDEDSDSPQRAIAATNDSVDA
ncbi:MAG: hypothetical protein NXI22_18465 [bacterium]|nr:hypothetical protein [bacterium]